VYTLFNKELNRFLKHPKDGVWATESFEDAEKLLEAAKEYVRAVGMPEIADYITILEVNVEQLQEG
jgi:hypothetical protein